MQHIASPLKQWLGSEYTLVTSEHNPQMMLRGYVKTTLVHTKHYPTGIYPTIEGPLKGATAYPVTGVRGSSLGR